MKVPKNDIRKEPLANNEIKQMTPNEVICEKFSKRLKELMNENEYKNSSQLEKVVSIKYNDKLINYKSIDNYLKNTSKLPSFYTSYVLSDLFDVSLDYLMCKTDKKNESKDISSLTGLSEKSIEVLMYINRHKDNKANDCTLYNNDTLKFINLVLESIYPDVIKSKKDKFGFPLHNIFELMEDYIESSNSKRIRNINDLTENEVFDLIKHLKKNANDEEIMAEIKIKSESRDKGNVFPMVRDGKNKYINPCELYKEHIEHEIINELNKYSEEYEKHRNG